MYVYKTARLERTCTKTQQIMDQRVQRVVVTMMVMVAFTVVVL